MEREPLIIASNSDALTCDNTKAVESSSKDELSTEKASTAYSKTPDKAAALTQVFSQLGTVIAAPLGGALYEAIGW